MAVLRPDGIEIYSDLGAPIEKERLTAAFDEQSAEKGGFPHFMLKEIHEQPSALRATIGPRVENGLPDLHIDALSDDYLAPHRERAHRRVRHGDARGHGGQDRH